MNKTLNIARGGLFTALTVLIIYITGITPTSKLTLLTAASAIIPYSILTTGIRNSFVVYAASSALSIIIGFRGAALAYLIFFGLYGFVKYYVESLNKILYEILIKLVYYNISLYAIYMIYRSLFTSNFSTKLPIYVLIAGAQVAFFIYDYALTLLINYIRRRFIKA